MLKDIPKLVVENIALAAVKDDIKSTTAATEADQGWSIYIVNLYDQPIEGVPQRRIIGVQHLLAVLPRRAVIPPKLPHYFLARSARAWLRFI